MITKIAHIGIAVKDIKAASEIYRKIFQTEPSPEEYIEEQKVKVVHFNLGDSAVELLQGMSPDSPISKFIEKHGEGIHHVSYESGNIEEDIERLEREGFELLYEKPKAGSGNSLITFLHPAETNGVLVEISQHQ